MPEALSTQRFDIAFIREIRRHRIERNWTQADLALRTQGAVTASALAGYESGHRQLRLHTAAILADALDIKFSLLVTAAEQALADAAVVLLDASRVMSDVDSRLEPVQRWLRAVQNEPGGARHHLPLSTSALNALLAVIGDNAVDSRHLLAPYLLTAPVMGPDSTRLGDAASRSAGPSRADSSG